jgi:peptidyl-prolyl cis-trans isomerase B (cyclophilin B)
VPTNQQRRDAAKRRLERQLVRRQQLQKSRRQRTIIGGVIAAVVVIAGVVFFVTRERPAEDTSAAADGATSTAPATACTYTDAETTVKAVNKPENTNPLTSGTVDATIALGQGEVPVTLDRALAPCAVNAFVSLAAQEFYDDTTCHRLTDAANFRILQCGDPSGTGRGGPGFSYAAEAAPADPAADPAVADPAGDFPVGTLAMAGSPTSTNGSQFVLVYGESDLSGGGLTKIGTVSAEGLAVVDQIAAKGTTAGPNGAADAPAETVEVTSVTVPDDAVTPTQPPAVTDSAPTDTLPTDTLTTDGAPADPAAPEGAPTGATDAAPTDAAPTDLAPSDGSAASPGEATVAPTS